MIESILGKIGRKYSKWRWVYRHMFRYVMPYYMKHHHRNGNGRVIINDYDGNMKFSLNRANWIGAGIFFLGYHSRNELTLLGERLRSDDVFIDIGANQGEFTLFAAKRLEKGKVFAFEPVPELYDLLSENILLNKLQNVEHNQLALSDSVGELEMFSSGNEELYNEGTSSFFKSDSRPVPVGRVEVAPLDTFLNERSMDKVDIIKIDVEGAEMKVLSGALETISTYKPDFIIELNRTALNSAGDTPEEIYGLLSEKGYIIYAIEHAGRIERMDKENIPDFKNILATARES